MSQLLHRQREDETLDVREEGAGVGRLRPVVVALIVAFGLLVGAAGGWVAASYWTRDPGLGVEEIQQARGEEMVDYHERLWLARTRLQEIARMRGEEMVDYHEGLWRAGQVDR